MCKFYIFCQYVHKLTFPKKLINNHSRVIVLLENNNPGLLLQNTLLFSNNCLYALPLHIAAGNLKHLFVQYDSKNLRSSSWLFRHPSHAGFPWKTLYYVAGKHTLTVSQHAFNCRAAKSSDCSRESKIFIERTCICLFLCRIYESGEKLQTNRREVLQKKNCIRV